MGEMEGGEEVRQRSQYQVDLERKLSPELGILFAALRSEFDAKLESEVARLQRNLLLLALPLGAIGGFSAELVRPSTVQVGLSLFLPFM